MYPIANAPAAAVLSVPTGSATTAFSVIAGEPGAGTQCNLNAPGSNKLNGQTFTVRAAGFITFAAGTVTTAATPIQIALYASNTASFAAASGNQIAALTAVPVFTYAAATAVSIPWEIEAELSGDSTSKSLTGVFQGYEGLGPNGGTNVAVARAICTNPLTTANYASEPPVQFAVAVVSASANNLPAGTTATMTQFVLES
jgi:hypothetical protein